jgi:uncharacterized phage protein (TIGR01671 family)
MNREIKFRAWDFVNKKMLAPNDILSMGANGRWIRYADQGYLVNVDDSNEFAPMQYTGIKDKNGVEIYEGDITNCGTVTWFENLNWDGGGSKHPGFYFREAFEGACQELDYHIGFDTDARDNDIYVVGNIYENSK